jgi:heme/copper-type cytochrome/quinol oxidase subunit 4
MSLSYQEKSIWGSLIATILVYGRYFASGSHGLVGTIVALVMIQIIFQIVIALADKPQPKDERDRLIEAKAYRIGYLLLVTGTIVCMGYGFQSGPTINALLLALMASEIGKSATQLYYYRRGV